MAISADPAAIGRHHRLLTDFRRAFREGPLEGGPLAIEGPRLIAEAIRSGQRLEKVLFSRTGLEQLGPRLLPQFSKHAEAAVADDAAFAGAMDSEHPQGVAALLRYAPAALDDVFGQAAAAAPPLVLAAAGLQDPGNLGTLIRAADAFGACGVAVLNDSASPFNPKAIRASAGSLFHLPVAARVPAPAFITACRQRGLRLLAADARGQLDPAAALAGPVAVLVGQEAGGIPRELLRAADATVAIPFARPVDSLNAAVAGAILLYEAAKQRRAGSGNLEMP